MAVTGMPIEFMF